MKLLRLMKSQKPLLSIVVIFYNMQREAQRTLYSLSSQYQQLADDFSYEVIAIDNGSTEPLCEEMVTAYGKQFRYIYFNAKTPSPCDALNFGVDQARGKYVMICIDGARILSPGILHYAKLTFSTFEHPFVYTVGMHIGEKPQNYLVEQGYSRAEEDKLIASVDWRVDGYKLFDISCFAFSSGNGFFATSSESNCFAIKKSDYQRLGGYNSTFKSAGGGVANLDFFNRANQCASLQPVKLLGEATFHQFHGGTATNVPMKDHPWKSMAAEYEHIYGRSYEIYERAPIYFGLLAGNRSVE
jgi:glycosyltransferase involved in cell wall biosynthesis